MCWVAPGTGLPHGPYGDRGPWSASWRDNAMALGVKGRHSLAGNQRRWVTPRGGRSNGLWAGTRGAPLGLADPAHPLGATPVVSSAAIRVDTPSRGTLYC